MFVPRFEYELIAYDPERPWIIVSTEQRSVDKPDHKTFFAWAARTWPDDRYRVLLNHPRSPGASGG